MIEVHTRYHHFFREINFSIIFFLFKIGIHLACEKCRNGFTTSRAGTVEEGECNVPICSPGTYLDSTVNDCVLCARGYYQQFDQRTSCDQCPPDTTTPTEGSRSPDDCTNK